MKSAQVPDYFDAKDTVARLEKALNNAIIKPPVEEFFRPAHEHVVDLGAPVSAPKETLSDYVVRRRDELARQQEELDFLQAVEALRQRFPRFFGNGQ